MENSYNPDWLVQAAKKQFPDKTWLAEALSKCTNIVIQDPQDIYFVDPENPNIPGSQWQFDENIILEDTEKGDIVLDILKNGRVGAIEFLSGLNELYK
jgi:hypothetical protein